MAKTFPTLGAIDFGSSKIAIVLAEMTPEGLEVIGLAQTESHGIRKGVIVHIDAVVESLQKVFAEIKQQSGQMPEYLVAGVSGTHVQAMSSKGMVPIRDGEVRQSDIERVIETASAINIPLDREVIQVVPQEFIIDGQDGIHEPLNMYGKRLEVNLQLITGSITALENIRRCLQKADVTAHHFLSTPVASARSVASDGEKQAGVCVVDIGAASTDLAVYRDGSLSWIRALPLGGMHLTHDLAVGLKTSLQEAEQVKKNFGCGFDAHFDETLEIKTLSGGESRSIEKRLLATILEPRLEEILGLVRNELARNGVDEALPSGVIFTGGGSHLKGLIPTAEKVFRLPVRLGSPNHLGLGGMSDQMASPAYASVAGLLQLGFEESHELQYYAKLYETKGFKKFQTRISRWMKDFF